MTPEPSGSPVWVELSGENLPLARAELLAASSVLDASSLPPRTLPFGGDRFLEVVFSRKGPEALLAQRLGFAHRVLRPIGEGSLDTLVDALLLEGGGGGSARVRLAPGAPATLTRKAPQVLGHAFVQGGGTIDLETPDRDFLAILPRGAEGGGGAGGEGDAGPPEGGLGEVLGEVPRSEVDARRSKNRPFRKPVTLPPRLARAAVNLARVPLGGRLLDPFCGTGSILIEAAALGYRVSGADQDAEMVRGTLTNLESQGMVPEKLVQAPVSDITEVLGDERFHGVVFDPPYGRASTTGGRLASEVLLEALQAAPRLLEKNGRVVLLLHDPSLLPDDLPGLERETLLLAERVHRSLTRWVAVLRSTRSG